MTRHALVVRLDSMGDVIVCGPAVRAVAATADRVSVLAGPRGSAAAALLPGVDAVIEWACPWIAAPPAPEVDADDIHRLTTQLRGMAIDEALILTSFHQTALPTALVLRLAGVERIAAVSTDYPGALLTTRIDEPPDGPEPQRMLAVAQEAGYRLPPGDDGALRVRRSPETAIERPYVVLHPGVDAPARAYPPELWRDVAALLVRNGRSVVVTGSAEEAPLTASIASAAPSRIVDLGGRTDLSTLAGVLAAADVVVVGNTGPAHLAAAVGAPVVSLFAPVVPAVRWAPYGERVTVLGDQEAPCRDSRARVCPVPGHPCLASVTPDDIVAALDELDALHPVLVS